MSNRKLVKSSNIDDILSVLMRIHPIPLKFARDPEKYGRSRNIVGIDAFLNSYASSDLPSSLIRNTYFAKRGQNINLV